MSVRLLVVAVATMLGSLATTSVSQAAFTLSITKDGAPFGFTLPIGPNAFVFSGTSFPDFNGTTSTFSVSNNFKQMTTSVVLQEGPTAPAGKYVITVTDDNVTVPTTGPVTLTSLLTSVITHGSSTKVADVRLDSSIVGAGMNFVIGSTTNTQITTTISGLPASPYTLQSVITIDLGVGESAKFVAETESTSLVPVPPTALAALALPLLGLGARLRRRVQATV